MEKDQEQKHECKVCKKRFFSGRSLGGHMRCHMAANSAPTDEKLIESDVGFEDGGDGAQTGYGLRENPKKSWRFSGSKQNAPRQEGEQEGEQEREHDHICKVCGKGFSSSRALFGHMRHHSRRENLCRECGKGFGSLRALSGHMRCHSEKNRAIDESTTGGQSQDESSGLTRKKRSKRYKISSNSSISNLNDSSSVSPNEPELEEGVVCLMLLSRGVRSWEEFNSVTESSDNNSVIAEAKYSHQKKPIIKHENENFVSNARDTSQMLKEKVKLLDSCAVDSGNVLFEKKVPEFGNSDSGFVRNEEKRIELEVCTDVIVRSRGLKKSGLDVESQNELHDIEIEKKFHSEMKIKTIDVELGNDLLKVGSEEADSESVKYNSSKRARSDAHDPDLEGNFCSKMSSTTSEPEIMDGSRKKRIYKCSTCSKTFHSHRALGGHKTRCPAPNSRGCAKGVQVDSLPDVKANSKLNNPEDNDSQIEHEMAGITGMKCELKKSKDHECCICFKVFASGQALGGHKRAHYAGSSETREEGTTVVQQEHSDICDSFDLNLPVKPWCFRGDHEHESLVGLISN